ncbi:DUF3618 domain-containing protein [Streptosporangium sp. KLBMP 9127]|nr:DUF3618 domain-containing protein [Streptosporangium sp. KLBMP 9127]
MNSHRARVTTDHREDPEALREQIAHTREELGATVAALAAKADVKARARLKADQMREDLSNRARLGLRGTRRRADVTGTRARRVTTKIRSVPAPARWGTLVAVAVAAVLAATAVRRRDELDRRLRRLRARRRWPRNTGARRRLAAWPWDC